MQRLVSSLGYQDIIDIIDDGDDFYTKPDFMNRLKDVIS